MTRRGTLQHRSEWLLVKGTLGLLRFLPGPLAIGVMRVAGRLGYWVLRERREQALRNVMLSLSTSRAESARIVRGAFRGLALNVAESMLLERYATRGALDERVTIEGAEHMQRALASGRGILVAAAHFGSWECMPLVLGSKFRKPWVVSRVIDNPYIERMAKTVRRHVLAGFLDKDGGGLKMARLIKKGEMVGLLLDQNAGREGVMLEFLGRQSWHHRVAGIMACRFSAIILPTYLLREPGHMRFRMIIEPPLEPDPALSGAEAENELVERLSRSLEERVRQAPEQWLWLHDRWRRAERSLADSQPDSRKGGPPTEEMGSALAESTNEG